MKIHSPSSRTQTELLCEHELSTPRLYQVVLEQQDETPMDFVTSLLMSVFAMDDLLAHQTLLEIRSKGQAICGVYPREVAEMKVSEALALIHNKGSLLRCFFELAL